MGNKGFTLIEMLIVILLISILTACLANLLMSGINTFTYMKNKIELQQNLRYALEHLIQEITNAREIIAISEDELTFFNRNQERITYSLAADPQEKEHLYKIKGRNLYRYTEKSKQPVANFIERISFKAETFHEKPQDITYIKVSLQGRTTRGKTLKFTSGAEVKWKSFGYLVQEN